uniref:tRNAdihydrouridine synthase putative n=1 Tax=Albugo laibachii Nc14 TaxID=890382 RepID=F0W6D1_9STRA|nr:tRNAdihydrouridine synthase putative [Albugo laibachii Nc14]|eukprot:CCA16675.1 tRNAdihydrouridine synthase putative [Albugo laibachii Nc14]
MLSFQSRDLRLSGVSKYEATWHYHIEILDTRYTELQSKTRSCLDFSGLENKSSSSSVITTSSSSSSIATLFDSSPSKRQLVVRYSVMRRFNDFRALYRQIVMQFGIDFASELPKLPDASWVTYIRANDPSFLRYRQQELETFIRALDSRLETRNSDLIERFLAPDSEDFISSNTLRQRCDIGEICNIGRAPSYVSLSHVQSPQIRFRTERRKWNESAMDWTDRHYRYLMRLITHHTQLYTEMLVDQTLLYQKDNLHYFLGHDDDESPLAVQLGGNSIDTLAAAAQLCREYGGFNEINLNCGCPSPKVSKQCFGAQLMLQPERVRDICAGMIGANSSMDPEITVKCRIGVDDCDSYEELKRFISVVSASGVEHFIVHARKCWLSGLNPHENRTIPTLNYDFVYQLKSDFPNLAFTLNGGVASIEEAHRLLQTSNMDGIMIGRAAYKYPWNFRNADRLLYGAKRNPNLSRREIIERYIDYAEDLQERWGSDKILDNSKFAMPTTTLVKPLLSLFSGEHGGKVFKRKIGEFWCINKEDRPGLREIVESAVRLLPDSMLDARQAQDM